LLLLLLLLLLLELSDGALAYAILIKIVGGQRCDASAIGDGFGTYLGHQIRVRSPVRPFDDLPSDASSACVDVFRSSLTG
jgi:hypothetical protein